MHEYPVNGGDKNSRKRRAIAAETVIIVILNNFQPGGEDVVFYLGAKRHNSRNFPPKECRRARVFGQGEELQVGDSQHAMNIPKTPVCR